MTVSTTLDRQYFNGNGVTVAFPFNFRFLANSQIFVSLIDAAGVVTLQTLGVNYSLSGVNLAGGGTVTMFVAPALGVQLLVQRVLPATQETSIRNQGRFFPEIHENVFDTLTMLIQQALSGVANALQRNTSGTAWNFLGLRGINAGSPINPTDVATKGYVDASAAGSNSYTDTQLTRTVRTQPGETLTVLPLAASRANKVMGFDALGNPIAVLPASGSGTELAIDLANSIDPAKGLAMIGHNGEIAEYSLRRLELVQFNVLRWVPFVEWAAILNGTSTYDATAAVVSACNAAAVMGGMVVFAPGLWNFGRAQVGSQRGIYVRGGTYIYAPGATFNMISNASFFAVEPDIIEPAQITADVAIGDTSFTVAAALTLAAGDSVLVRLNTAAYDAFEPATWYWDRVVSVVGTVITLAKPSPVAMSVAGTTAINRRIVKVSDCRNVVIDGAKFICNQPAVLAQVEACVNARYTHGVTVINCSGGNFGSGILITQFCTAAALLRTSGRNLRAETGSKGRMASFAETDGVLVDLVDVENFENVNAAFTVEADCKSVRFGRLRVDTNGSLGSGGRKYAISCLGQGFVQVDDLTLTGTNLYPITGSQILGKSIINSASLLGAYTANGWNGASAIVNTLRRGTLQYTKRRTVTLKVALVASTNKTINVTGGLICSMRLLADNIAGITGTFMRRDGPTNNGSNFTPVSSGVVRDETFDLINVGVNQVNFDTPKQLRVEMNGSVVPGTFLYVELDILELEGGAVVSGTGLLNQIEA